MYAHAKNFGADVVISNMDTWVIEPGQMQNDIKWAAWLPIDSDPIPAPVLYNIKKAWHRIVWTKHAAALMDKEGLDYDYVPYGVDTKLFSPNDKLEARRLAHMPEDKFIVGMVAMNKGYPCRKAFHENIAAFARLHEQHPDTFLYLHTADGTRGVAEQVNLMEYCLRLGLKHGEDFIFADQYQYVIGYPDSAMNVLYNCMDVHLLVSMGEGFGIPQVEAQSCGVPVICGDWTAMPELCFSGWKVDKKDATPIYTLLQSYQFAPRIDAIVEKLEQAYKMRGNPDYSKRAREGALKYDIDVVFEKYWKPTLKRMSEKLAQSQNEMPVFESLRNE